MGIGEVLSKGLESDLVWIGMVRLERWEGSMCHAKTLRLAFFLYKGAITGFNLACFLV